MTKDDRAYMTMMFEQILGQNQLVLEAVGDMQTQINHMPTMEQFERLESKFDVLEFAIKDLSAELRDHDRRISALEKAA